MKPKAHWSFRCEPGAVDLERILREVHDEGGTVARVRAGKFEALLVRVGSIDAYALLTAEWTITITSLGNGWLAVAAGHVDRATAMIREFRDHIATLPKPIRTTVEIL